jgi:hypothetical protein
LRNELTDGLFSDQHLQKIDRLREVHGLTDERAHNLFSETKVYPDARFVHWMRALRHLTEIKNPGDQSCIALYFLMDGLTDRCRHAALRDWNGRMTSKWGTYAVYEHDLAEVPSNYGDHILYVAKPSDNDIRELFAAYIARCQALPKWALPFGS